MKDVKEILDRAGMEFKVEHGLVVRRARSTDGDLYEITFWSQFKTYRRSPSRRLPCLRASAAHSRGRGLTRGYKSAQKSRAGQKPEHEGASENVLGKSR